ncbi:virulence RhuM family protein [Petrimonas sp.]|uniref:virulence RhuM family protein n=1 Tax=Petrimonas sp. TaxID=2023866 RepID=UPI003F517C87
MSSNSEIILYEADEALQLEVRIEEETVWLTQSQMTVLFETTKQNISLHINNVFKEKELDKNSTVKYFLIVQSEGNRIVRRNIEFYNLDVIISVGYRVKSQRGTQFRIWANRILKDYLLRGYAANQRFERIEQRLHDHDQKFDLLLKTSLPPLHGIFFDGQIFDAHKFVSDLVKSAEKEIVLIDNYIDESVLFLLSKRQKDVSATVFTSKISKQLQLDIEKFNTQYAPIGVKIFTKSHDRFLILDNKTVYHIGASLKDLGKKWFAFSLIKLNANEIIQKLK